jgi:hypothetical protein
MQLSDPIDEVLQLQNVGWLIRKAVGYATVTLHIKQYEEEGIEHIDIDQVIIGGIKGTTELRTFNDEWREHSDHIFGRVKGRNRRIKLSELKEDDEDEAFIKKGWSQDIVDSDELIDGIVDSEDNAWTGRLTWGFEVVDGERRFARHSVVRKKDSDVFKRVRLVYDYKGPLAA